MDFDIFNPYLSENTDKNNKKHVIFANHYGFFP